MTDDPLGQEGWAQFLEGAELFDSGRHHASHEAFEKAWLAARRGGRPAEAFWWQGLVLCAGALHHRGKGNQKGAHALSERAQERFNSALQLAPDTNHPRAWWEAPCAEWRKQWTRVSLETTDVPRVTSAAADPRLRDLFDRHKP